MSKDNTSRITNESKAEDINGITNGIKVSSFFSFIISLFMVLTLFVLQFSFVAADKLLAPDFYIGKFRNMGLYNYIQTSIDKDLSYLASTSNIPDDLFKNLVTKEWIQKQVETSTTSAGQYMLYKSNNLYVINTDSEANKFSQNIDTFIKAQNLKIDGNVSKEFNVIKGEVSNIIKNEASFISINNLAASSAFQRIRKSLFLLYTWKSTIVILLCALSFILLLLNIKNLLAFFSWIGYTCVAAGALTLVPAALGLYSNFTANIAISIPTVKNIAAAILNDFMLFFVKLGGGIAVAGVMVLVVVWICGRGEVTPGK